MPDSRPTVHLYARGWLHEAWSGDFYPEDLPAAWRLTYYANEFHGVLVPLADWQEADESRVSGWREDAPEAFRFYVERADAAPDEADRRKVRLLGEGFSGWVEPGVEPLPSGVLPCTVAGSPAAAQACRLPPMPATQLADQRRLLEGLAQSAEGGGELLLFLDGEPPQIGLLRSLCQLSQLLGLA